MHIERILLRDVGPFDDVTIELPKGTDPTLADVYLLTGPNGTGKSTILYALASAIGGGSDRLDAGVLQLGRDLVGARMRSKNSLVAVRSDSGQTFALTPRVHPVDLRDPFSDSQLLRVGSGSLAHWQSHGLPRYDVLAASVRLDEPPELRTSLDWAPFAYAGVRSVSDVEVTAIREPEQSPFENSLSFLQTTDTSLLANWIASQNHRRLQAKEAGHNEQAEQFARSIRDIERVIAEIVEDPGFAFINTYQDDNVRVRWKGTVIRLGLLPDGLKSIVSWVADLLMRLDRIPWQDNKPVLQRRFLLLLDEVDIHLHPAWQRRVLPLVQRVFPNAQIIASTHSPFVVSSVDDARIITLGFRGQTSHVIDDSPPQIGRSYTAVLRSVFGIDSEFDLDTEQNLKQFHEARQRLIAGDASADLELKRLADLLSSRSEELREIVALELVQLQRQLARRAAP